MTHEQNQTHVQYVSLAQAFDLLNQTLFEGALPSVLVTLQRHANSRGYYARNMFTARETVHHEAHTSTDEIALNPDAFRGRTDREIFSTLAHEMVHLWQAVFGKAPNSGYHNKQWGDKMESIGLMPSATGAPGGARTGNQMTHYIIEGGAFARSYDAIEAQGLRITWESTPRDAKAKKKAKSKTKYTCAACQANAWAKPQTQLTCTPCDMPMVAEEGDEEPTETEYERKCAELEDGNHD